MLGGGLYASKDDLRFSLQGVYVAEAGRLRAQLALDSPAHAALLPEAERDQHTADYRTALRDAALDVITQTEQPHRRPQVLPEVRSLGSAKTPLIVVASFTAAL